ncbi:TPA: hypothetical protein ACF7BE_000674 [Streptococcus agalactiae]
MKIEFFLKQGPTKSVSNYGEVGIDEVIGAIKNNDIVALNGKKQRSYYTQTKYFSRNYS